MSLISKHGFRCFIPITHMMNGVWQCVGSVCRVYTTTQWTSLKKYQKKSFELWHTAKVTGFTAEYKVMAHKSCHKAAALLCAVIMTYILTASWGKNNTLAIYRLFITISRWSWLTGVGVNNWWNILSLGVSGGRNVATRQRRKTPRCHTFPPHPWVISISLGWQHLPHGRQRPSVLVITGERVWQPTYLNGWVRTLTNRLRRSLPATVTSCGSAQTGSRVLTIRENTENSNN